MNEYRASNGVRVTLHTDGSMYFGGPNDALDADSVKAAREFFDAHPEPKPAWHGAKQGEVWVVTIDGHARPHYVEDNRGDTVGGIAFVAISPTHGQPGHVGINAPAVSDARRIYPEDKS